MIYPVLTVFVLVGAACAHRGLTNLANGVDRPGRNATAAVVGVIALSVTVSVAMLEVFA